MNIHEVVLFNVLRQQ